VFDISFGEMFVCLVVFLVVIGPERLPETVRTVALWVGRLKRSLRDTRAEIERQIGADEIRRQLYNEEIIRSIERTHAEMNQTINKIGQDIQNPLHDLTEEQKAAAYSPPQELPDHSHTNEAPAPVDNTTTTNPDTTTKA
jgi:sec-independent protein translocase protein TatB